MYGIIPYFRQNLKSFIAHASGFIFSFLSLYVRLLLDLLAPGRCI